MNLIQLVQNTVLCLDCPARENLPCRNKNKQPQWVQWIEDNAFCLTEKIILFGIPCDDYRKEGICFEESKQSPGLYIIAGDIAPIRVPAARDCCGNGN